MDHLRCVRLFCTAVELGSLVGAAEALDISTPMASKYLGALEARLGTRLLHRNTRHRSPTAAGQSYYAQCREALNLLDAADDSLLAGAAVPTGELRVTAPTWFATPDAALLLAAHRRLYPAVTLHWRLEDRFVDLVSEAVDVALRVTHTPAPSIVARPLCSVSLVPVAAPELVARMPALRSPAELIGWDAIVRTDATFDGYPMARADGSRALVTIRPVLRTNFAGLMREAVLTGTAYAFLPMPMVRSDLAAGRLVRLLPDWHGQALPVIAVYASRRQVAPKLRSFIDLLVERLPGIAGFEPLPFDGV